MTAERIDGEVAVLFAMVSQALGQATHALLNSDLEAARGVVEADAAVDALTEQVEQLVWNEIEATTPGRPSLRYLVSVLMILPELERSADLAEHIAQRAADNLGVEMSPLSRGIVQRMAEVALEMWVVAANAFSDRQAHSVHVDEADTEIDILSDRLYREIAAEVMPPAVAGQVALLARFYERLGDHAVNLARKIDELPPRD